MRALICGVTGQDGAYLANLLISKGYEVIGTSRDAMVASKESLLRVGLGRNDVELASMAVNDFRSVLGVVQRFSPDEIYNLAGQTSVGLSFEQPVEAMESIAHGALNMLEAIRFVDKPIRFYNAGSSECFGDTGCEAATEIRAFKPQSPYAVAKASAYWLVQNYREAYGIFCCTGILFNHESPLRPERFVTQKIISAAARIAKGQQRGLELGSLGIYRDWGWAPDFVEAMWLMLQQEKPDDYVIATGESSSLEYFVERAFANFGLDWRQYVSFDNNLKRPTDINRSCGDPTKAYNVLGWKAKFTVNDVIDSMCESLKFSM